MKIGALFIFTLITVAGRSQNTINSYKYVLVPQKFDFLKADDEYGLNTTTKSLLEQKGFTVFWSNASLPQTVAANRCIALIAEVTQRKAMFTTNLTVLLKDCSGNIIFKSKEGRSREKEFYTAYDEALRDALSSLTNLPYKYDSTLSAPAQQLTPASPTSPQAPVTVQHEATAQHEVATQHAVADISGTLYAQVIPNGYQLIDTTPKKVLTLLKTSVQDCFLAETGVGARNGIVFKRNGEWFFDYYKDSALVSQKLEIKF
ncbi:MAG TPA: hypothetical protein VKQ08_06305 [Cyclobacteriaceae bacterium]|nr:hypothetical protein [Cyclobacteriaceae bacterium]